MKRSRLLRLGGIGYTVVEILAAVLVAMGALGLLLKLAAVAGVLPAKLAAVAKAMPSLSTTVTASPTTQSVSSIALVA